ncbi:YbaB/EbfC family nucleoid-associated protein [Nonomuraea zeae]|uniref:YbaB/EbfC family nucleoid-associated protein n=1 Tax=Nonomuraea zeae TaxID=1642303 RepID=A0A5S4FW82_9ACTN|nr:YbaB/EbfC family nucleoid-associated protein [Nonomuraea zeae]TMR15040.1 YbaB/EbfC family nucleoid-associated protein [Nonomuraea zeae]
MSQEFRAMIEGLAEEYNRQAAQIRDMHAELKDLVVTATSDDGLVTVTMGHRGQLRSLTLNPRVYRKLSPSELSSSIMTQVGAATARVAERTKELMAPFVPEGLAYEEVFGENAGLDAFLPKPVDLSGEGAG